jgi:hypothetical protein
MQITPKKPRKPNKYKHLANPGKSGKLNAIIEAAAIQSGCTLAELTVMHSQRDPYRQDSKSGRLSGEWLVTQIEQLITDPNRKIHLRGVHYVLTASGIIYKLDASLYVNTNEDWISLSETAAKAARWLGLKAGGVPLFERIVDERNEEPYIYVPEFDNPTPIVCAGQYLELGLPVQPELILDCAPWPVIQPNRIVMVGEKTSLKEVLDPIARQCKTELVLPTGELSDTRIYEIAKRAAADGRPLVILYFSDFDPAGYNMVTVVSRKLQALRDLFFPELEIRVFQVALTLEQVQDLDLPSTPLKETEKRADKWKALMGHEQTEIDALATLDPDKLKEIALEALKPFHDFDHAQQIAEAEEEWREEAQRVIEAHPAYSDSLRNLELALSTLKDAAQIYSDVQEEAELAVDDVDAPLIELPEPDIWEDAPEPVYNSADDWQDATRKLVERKKLSGEED